MLLNPTIYKLQQLRLHTMAESFRQQQSDPKHTSFSFEERLSLLVDQEITARENRKLQTRLRGAKLQQSACFEDIDYHSPRSLDRSLLATLSQGTWISSHHNILIVGPCGTGKTFLACALAHKACLHGSTAIYLRISRLLSELALSKGDGQYHKRMSELAKTDVLILDDFGLSPLTDEARRDLLEILDDRHDKRSTIVTSQIPVKLWHETIGNETLADAILDRLVHNSHRLEIKGESMRKTRAQVSKTKPDTQEKEKENKSENETCAKIS
jgi:DNA replication protein DnaC